MKTPLFVIVCFVVALAASVPSFAQSSGGLPAPTKAELESVIGGMGLSLGEKLSLRKILQAMQEQGEKVKDDDSLSKDQKTAQILKIRQDALGQTGKILTDDQQKQLAALLLPKE
ncbi:MAG: hypothetical protein ACREKL_13825 [Chthoniobacterales bacterium]